MDTAPAEDKEKTLPNGQIICFSCGFGSDAYYFTVACINADNTVHWSLDFDDLAKAQAEYDRWN